MATQEITLQPGESRQVSFEATPHEAKVYQVSVDGLVGSFTAIAPAPPSGEILEITWWDGTTWRPISDPMPEYEEITHRFRIRNTGAAAKFKIGVYQYNAFQGWFWTYSPSFDIEPGEGNIDWRAWTGRAATRTITWHLFSDDTEVDSMTTTITVR